MTDSTSVAAEEARDRREAFTASQITPEEVAWRSDLRDAEDIPEDERPDGLRQMLRIRDWLDTARAERETWYEVATAAEHRDAAARSRPAGELDAARKALDRIAQGDTTVGGWDGWREVRRLRDIARTALDNLASSTTTEAGEPLIVGRLALGSSVGACFRACLATITGLDIPDVDNGPDWFTRYQLFLHDHGWTLEPSPAARPVLGFSVALGEAPSGVGDHAMVALDGVVIWDPGTGRTSPGIFVPRSFCPVYRRRAAVRPVEREGLDTRTRCKAGHLFVLSSCPDCQERRRLALLRGPR